MSLRQKERGREEVEEEEGEDKCIGESKSSECILLLCDVGMWHDSTCHMSLMTEKEI